MSGWCDEFNAEKYDQYAKKFPTYQSTSQDLVQFSDIKSNMVVVDLACGTGITSQAILKSLGESSQLYCVDASTAMLEVARRNLKDQDNVTFYLSQAERLQDVITRPIDRVICNAAFWQMNPDATLRAIHGIMSEKGSFVYNLPHPFFSSSEAYPGTGQAIGFAEHIRQIAQSDFDINISMPTESTKQYRPPTLDDIRQTLGQNGFTLIAHKIITYAQTIEGAHEFCTIPVMTERILPGISYQTRMAILEKARHYLAPTTELKMPWLFLKAKITD